MAVPKIIENASPAEIAQWIKACLDRALAAENGRIAIAVPGGLTPFPILQLLAQSALDWSRITVWPSDDRMVREDHEASNTGRIRALMEPVGADVAALSLTQTVPHFALVWLGMGADGHIASLFPNNDPQVDDPRAIRQLTPDPLPPQAPFDRITLTIPSLLNSDALMFVMRGADKRAMLDGAVAGRHDVPVARLLGAAQQDVTCFV